VLVIHIHRELRESISAVDRALRGVPVVSEETADEASRIGVVLDDQNRCIHDEAARSRSPFIRRVGRIASAWADGCWID